MEQPKISIIVPVYNVELYLEKCVQSLVNQTLKEIQIILVDDGSKDRSSDICDEWSIKDNRILVIHKDNEGQSKARNIGMKYAIGEFIAFVDSDDFIDVKTYEIMYNECVSKKLDAAYFSYNRVNSNGEVITNVRTYPTEFFLGKEQVRKLMLNIVGRKPSEYQLKHYTTSASMSLFKTRIVKENGLQFPDVREVASEDLLFSLLFLATADNVGCFPYVFYHYFVNENSTTTTFNDGKYQRMVNCLIEVKKICDRNFSEKEYMPHFLSQILRIYKIAMRYGTIRETSRKEKIKKLKEYCRSPWMQIVYNHRETKNFPLKDRVFLFFMKKEIFSFFQLIYRC